MKTKHSARNCSKYGKTRHLATARNCSKYENKDITRNSLATLTSFSRWVKILGYLKLYPEITNKEIAKKLKLSSSRASRLLNDMKRQGLIFLEYRDVFNKWTPTKKGLAVFRGSLTSSNCISNTRFNYHDLQVKIPILSKPERFEELLVNQGFEVATRRHYKGFQRQLAQGTVLVTPKSILFYPLEIWGDDPDDCARQLVQVAQATRIRLEEEFQGLRLGYPEGWEAGFKLTRQHLAMVGGLSDLIPEGYSNRADDRLVVEASKTPEFETVHPKYAYSDMDQLVGFNRAIIKQGITGEDLVTLFQVVYATAENVSALSELTTRNAQELKIISVQLRSLIELLTTVLGVDSEFTLKDGPDLDAPDNTRSEGGSVGYG